MKIAESKVALTSQHQFEARFNRVESLRYWKDQPDQTKKELEQNKNDLLDLSQDALKALKTNGTKQTEDFSVHLSEKDKQKILLMEKLLKAITGKNIKIAIPEQIVQRSDGLKIILQQTSNEVLMSGQMREGWGFDYQYHQTYQETEKLSFAAAGVIKTTDGKEIDFQLDLNLSRSFLSNNHISVKAGDALIDPLVINYDGPAATLTDTKYQFDLDADGLDDSISFLQQGSGFLALDKNGDGIVSNGQELFGVDTGDGFSELAAFDEDHNGWIDESDPVYDRLRIWTKNAEGKDVLFALAQKGIGAIYLGNIDGQFTYANSYNEHQGISRKAGIFVKEDGGVGSVQQIDLVI